MVVSVFLYQKRRRFRFLPGPPIRHFFLGHVPELRQRSQQGKPFHTWHLELYHQHGDIFILWMMHRESIYVCHPDAVREVLLNPLHPKSPVVYKKSFAIYGQRFLGSGLASNTDHGDWHRRHNVIAPAFKRKNLRHWMSDFNSITQRFLNHLLATAGQIVSMKQLFPQLTVDLIAKIAFGLESHTIGSNNSNPGILKALANSSRGFMTANLDPFLWLKPWKRRTIQGIHDAIRELRQISKDCICERQKQLRAQGEIPNDILSSINRMAQEYPDLTIEDLIDEVATIFVAGYDTTATALCLAIREMSQAPEIERRLCEEITEVLGSRKHVKFEDLAKLQFTAAIFKEVLRLCPAAYATIRQMENPTSMCGVNIPAKSNLVVSFYVMHRIPAYWKEPDRFSPDRFLMKEKKNIEPFTYMPFGLGPRACLGKQVANIEATLVLARLYQTFRFEVLEDPKTWGLTQDMVLRPNTDVLCKVHLRTQELKDSQ